jgi:metal-responsive CopG/Arc/MetJ family transcriptional regulator
MKTAISLPDDLFRAADKAAKDLGVSRSELYARAVAALLASRAGASVTAALDRVYANDSADADAVLASLQRRVLEREDW